MLDALGGALCVWAVLAALAALRASSDGAGSVRARGIRARGIRAGGIRARGALPAARRRVLWEIATMGAVLIVVYAMAGRADAVMSMLVALVIAGGVGGAAVAGRGVPSEKIRGSFQPLGPIAAMALALPLLAGTTPLDAPIMPAAALAGAAGAWAASILLRETGVRLKLGGAPWHFACAGACALLAYVAGLEPGPVAVVEVGGMIALIGGQLAVALGGDAWSALSSILDGCAACSVVAAGVAAGSGATIVVGVVLAVGCAAVHAGALSAQRRCI